MSGIAPSEQSQRTLSAYHVFLSYNRKDAEAVGRLRELLASRKVRSFLDLADLPIGHPWQPEINKAIQSIQAIAVFLGPSGLGDFQEHEIQLAVQRQSEQRVFLVIPVLLPNFDLATIPPDLQLNTWLDLRDDLENPTALDKLAGAVLGESNSGIKQPAIELCPYLGLNAFREVDAWFFSGRESFSQQLRKDVSAHRLTTVVGPSGSGKSSLVQAGLLPLLKLRSPEHAPWIIVTFKPDNNPFHHLARALFGVIEPKALGVERIRGIREFEYDLRGARERRLTLGEIVREALRQQSGRDRVLIFVDQFEELFTLTAEELRLPFIDCLLEDLDRFPYSVLLALRADYVPSAIALSRNLTDRLNSGTVFLGPMTREELQRAIKEPARKVGLHLDPVLVERLLNDVEHDPGNLPLLEFALKELWEKRVDNRIAKEAYRKGDVASSIAARAEKELQDRLADTGKREVVRNLLCRLLRVAEGGEEGGDTRTRVALEEFGDEERQLILKLTKARLLVTSTDHKQKEVVEVAHEALIRNWPLLQEWLKADREFLLWRQRFRRILAEWVHVNKDQSALLSGPLLVEAKRWMGKKPTGLNSQEKEFIRRSSRHESAKRRLLQVAAFFLMIALLGTGGWRFYIGTDSYLVGTIINKAPEFYDSDAQSANLWLQSLALSGRLDSALEAANGNPDRLIAISQAFLQASLEQTGRQILNQAISSTPSDPLDPRALLRALVRSKRISDARRFADAETKPLQRAKKLSMLADELEKAGLPEDAREVALQAAQTDWKDLHPDDVARVMIEAVVGSLARTGQTKEALSEARKLRSPYHDMAIEEIVKVLATSGETRRAKEIADTIQDPSYYPVSLGIVSESFVKAGYAEQARRESLHALGLARAISDDYFRSLVLSKLVGPLLKTGNTREALQVALNEIDPKQVQSYRTQALTTAAIELAERGDVDRVSEFFHKARESLGDINSRNLKSQQLTILAIGLARLNDFRLALDLGNHEACLDSDRLTVYASILLNHARGDDPNLNGLVVDPKTKLITKRLE